MTFDDFPQFIREYYEIHEWRHASAILVKDFLQEWQDLVTVLSSFRLHKSFIATPGGSKSKVALALDNAFYARGWIEKSFDINIVVDNQPNESPTHSIDYYKNGIAIETEWNNKNPFFDRDLNNFRLLFELRAISVGVIITRCDELQDIFEELGRGSSYGASTTHMSKLLPLINGGAGGGCPILVFGISRRLYEPNL